MLASHNALICKNIIVPDTLEGMQRLHDRMAQCGNTLRSIVHHTIGSKRHTIESINTALQEFTKAHAEIQDLSKKYLLYIYYRLSVNTLKNIRVEIRVKYLFSELKQHSEACKSSS